MREFVDGKGNVTLIDIGSVGRGPNGALDIPAGLLPKTARPTMTTEQRLKLANDIATAQSIPLGEALLQVDSYSGAAPSASAQSLVMPDLQKQNAAVKERTQNPSQARGRPVDPALIQPVGKVAVQPAPVASAPQGGGRILSQVNDGRYNVQLPDGRTTLVTHEQAAQLGLVQPRRGFQLPSNVQNNFLTYGGMPGYNY